MQVMGFLDSRPPREPRPGRSGATILALCALIAACGQGGGSEDAGEETDTTGDGVLDATDGAETPGDGVETGECTGDGDCDDDDPCTSDTCDLDWGRCEHSPVDADGDGFAAGTVGETTCPGTDCDDDDDDAWPGNTTRRCDADSDCNGRLDEDNDGDGHASEACGGDDCDDEDEGRSPSLPPGCTSTDADCNGRLDEDNDGDGHTREACGGDDCDDEDPDAFPGAPGVCGDGVDQNCNGVADEPVPMGVETRIVQSAAGATHPCVEWTGSELAVAWIDASSLHPEIRFQRATEAGEAIGSPLTVSGDHADPGPPVMVWTGSEHGILWRSLDAGTEGMHLARVSPDGSLSASSVHVSGSPGDEGEDPALAWTGSSFGLIWTDRRDGGAIVFLPLDPEAAPLGAEVVVAGPGSSMPAHADLAWSDSTFGVVWTEDWFEGTVTFFGTLSATGTVLVAGSQLNDTLTAERPLVAWSGSAFGITWHEFDQTWFTAVDQAGTKLVPETLAHTGADPLGSWSMRWCGTGWIVGVSEPSRTAFDVALVPPSGTATGVWVEVASGPGDEDHAALACTAGAQAVVWDDDRRGIEDLWLRILDGCG